MSFVYKINNFGSGFFFSLVLRRECLVDSLMVVLSRGII